MLPTSSDDSPRSVRPSCALAGAFVVMAAIALMTFEGMAMGVARFMDQRVHDVIEARTTLEGIKDAQATSAADFDKATTEAAVRRDACFGEARAAVRPSVDVAAPAI